MFSFLDLDPDSGAAGKKKRSEGDKTPKAKKKPGPKKSATQQTASGQGADEQADPLQQEDPGGGSSSSVAGAVQDDPRGTLSKDSSAKSLLSLLDKRNPNLGSLPGGRAFGLLALLALSLCTFYLYSRMYGQLRPPKMQQEGAKPVLDPSSVGSSAARLATEVQPQTPLTLREAVENAAGPNRSIIFVSTSASYLDFTENWYASVDKFGYGSRVVFIAEDREAYEHLRRKWPRQAAMVGAHELNLDEALEHEPVNSTYGSSHYNSLVDRRPEYFKLLVDMQVSFLYNDVDIVWLKDPYPFFTGEYDMWVQEDAIALQLERFPDQEPVRPLRDKRHSLCTCFMMVRPTRASRFLIHRWSRHVRDRVKRYGTAVLNQPAFNKALSLTPDREVAIGVLPVVSFPSGFIFFRCGGQPYCKKNWMERERFWKEVKRRKSWPVMVHNNWLEGHEQKLARFKEYNLWLLNNEDKGSGGEQEQAQEEERP